MTTKFDVRNAGGESLSTDGLLDSRELANCLADEIEQDADGAVECSVVEVDVEQRYENRDERLGDKCVFTLAEMRACYRANGWDNGMSDDELDEDILSHDVVEVQS